ncbi:MAG: class I SAM-dependent methyltransferase [Clostridiales bacterium]|jgi:ubiquinone/menaquinone biosynthesis C-methylase UbiE|nr:class I SAM-dependent methyltransferase [Clostridiales bacterium]
MALTKHQRKNDSIITGILAKWYNKNTQKFRLKEMRKYAEIVTNHAPNKATILEIAPGPGYLSIELAKLGYTVIGVELSEDFVKIEKHNAAIENVTVDFRHGNADKLPLINETVDFVVCTAAFKNFKYPVKALHEMYRVLKTGGTALILDMNHNATKEDINFEIENSNMKGFDRFFTKISFKTFLKSSAYTRDEFEQFIAKSPFKKSEIIKFGIGFQILLYK